MKILTNTFSVFTYLCVIIFRLKKGPKDLKNYCKKNHQFDCCFTSGLTMFRSYENVIIALKDFKLRPMLYGQEGIFIVTGDLGFFAISAKGLPHFRQSLIYDKRRVLRI